MLDLFKDLEKIIRGVKKDMSNLGEKMLLILPILQNMQKSDCPRLGSIQIFAIDFVESRRYNNNHEFSQEAKRVQEHFEETNCLVCRLIFLYSMSTNIIRGNVSENQSCRLILYREIEKLLKLVNRGDCFS